MCNAWIVVGRIIRLHRKRAQLSLAQTADLVGLDKGSLSRIENGKAATSVETLFAIAAALHINPAALTAPFFSAPGSDDNEAVAA